MSPPNLKLRRFYYSRDQEAHLENCSRMIIIGHYGLERRPYIPKFAWIRGEVVHYTEEAPVRNTWKSFPAHKSRFSDSHYLGIGVDFKEAVDDLLRELEEQFK